MVRRCGEALSTVLGLSSALLSGAPDADWRLALGDLVSRLHGLHPGRTLFIFDDAQYLSDKPQLWNVLSLFIERAPPGASFIIGSRTKPALSSLPRLELQGEVAWYGADSLRFSSEEAGHLLKDLWGRRPETSEVQNLLDRSRGWPAGLVLMARAGPKGSPSDVVTGGGEGLLFDYLTEEVFSRLSEALRRFLTRSAILTEFTVELCDQLLGTKTAREAIDQVKGRGLFLEERASPTPTYRYHDLFRDFLMRQMREESPGEYRALHRRAAQLLEAAGDHDAAVRHLVSAETIEAAIGLVKRAITDYFRQGKWQTLLAWLSLLPQEQVGRDPDLLLLRGKLLVRLGEPAQALDSLDKAIGFWHAQGAAESLGAALTAKSHACRALGKSDRAVAAAREALATLKAGDAHASRLVEAYRQLASALAVKGELDEAKQQFEQALELAGDTDLEAVSIICDGLGAAHTERGELDRAIHYLEKARNGWAKLGNEGALGYTLNNLAIVYFYLGEFDLALGTATAAVRAAGAVSVLPPLSLATVTQGLLYRALGRYQEALTTLLRGLDLARDMSDARLIAEATSALASTYRRMGDTSKAEALLGQALLESKKSEQRYAQARYHIALAKVYSQQGRHREALEQLALGTRMLRQRRNLRALAEAKLVEAVALYRSGHVLRCLKALSTLAAMVKRLGYEGFLLADGEEVAEVIHLAAVKRLGEGLFERLLARVKEQVRHQPGERDELWQVLTSLPRLKVFALGEARVLLEHHLVTEGEWESAKAKELLYFLLCTRKPLRADAIIDALWPEGAGSEQRKLLNTTVYRLRRGLYPECVVCQGGSYCLNPRVPVDFDVDAFDRSLRAAHECTEREEVRAEHLRKAVEVYKGPFLDGADGLWCQEMRASLESRYRHALLSLASYYLTRDQITHVRDMLDRALSSDPYDEDAHYLLAVTHLKTGDSLAALRQIRRFQQIATTELGIVVSGRWRALYEQAIKYGAGIAAR
jgi:ATP/maltotriose-dependent transcriptional regulator MalT